MRRQGLAGASITTLIIKKSSETILESHESCLAEYWILRYNKSNGTVSMKNFM